MDFLLDPEKFTSGNNLTKTISWKTAAGISAASFLGGIGLIKLKQHLDSSRTNPKEIPTKWVKVGTVQKLIIYPVKSCKGVEVPSAEITEIGLKASRFLRDRVFMIVDGKGNFQTQRQCPTLALIHIDVTDTGMTFSAPGVESVTIPIDVIVQDPSAVRKSCRIFGDHVPNVLDCGDAVGKWLDNYLEKSGFRLVYQNEEKTQRKITKKYLNFPYITPKDHGAFQDETSYMLMTEESMTYVNTKLPKPASLFNFRPTIFLEGVEGAFDEDDWKFIRIQNKETGTILKTAMPCSRCRLTTVDPETGTFNADGEPLKTMFTLKRRVGDPETSKIVEKQAILGNHFGLYHVGDSDRINIGDKIYAALQ